MKNRNEYMREYRRSHRLKISEINKRYYGKNSERIKAYVAEYRVKLVKPEVSVIYGIFTKSDSRIVYIGETLTTVSKRMAGHKRRAFKCNSQAPIHRAMREYGWDAFEFVVVDDTVDFNPMFTENYFIQLLSPVYNDKGGNMVRKVRDCS